jgi:hypothetical protein
MSFPRFPWKSTPAINFDAQRVQADAWYALRMVRDALPTALLPDQPAASLIAEGEALAHAIQRLRNG